MAGPDPTALIYFVDALRRRCDVPSPPPIGGGEGQGEVGETPPVLQFRGGFPPPRFWRGPPHPPPHHPKPGGEGGGGGGARPPTPPVLQFRGGFPPPRFWRDPPHPSPLLPKPGGEGVSRSARPLPDCAYPRTTRPDRPRRRDGAASQSKPVMAGPDPTALTYFVDTLRRRCDVPSPPPIGGGEGQGEVGETPPVLQFRGKFPPPSLWRDSPHPSPLLPKPGGEGVSRSARPLPDCPAPKMSA
jgi:hypothetical protein